MRVMSLMTNCENRRTVNVQIFTKNILHFSIYSCIMLCSSVDDSRVFSHWFQGLVFCSSSRARMASRSFSVSTRPPLASSYSASAVLIHFLSFESSACSRRSPRSANNHTGLDINFDYSNYCEYM